MNFEAYIQDYGRSHRVFWAGEIPWRKYKGIVQPLGPPHIEPKHRPAEIKKLLRESKAPLAMWTHDFDSANSRSWWWLIAEKPYSLPMLDKKARYEIRYGLKNCTAKIISGQLLAEIGFHCYKSAMRRHAQTVPQAESTFQRAALGYDINTGYEIWGIFVSDRLAGYGTYQILDNAVMLEDAIFDPEFFKYRQAYALMHVATDYYLNQKGFLYLTTGMRSISHETQFQDFLIRNFGYRKAYSRLGLAYSFSFRIMSNAIYRLEPVWHSIPFPKKIKGKLKVIQKLQAIMLEQGDIAPSVRSSTDDVYL